MLNQIFPIIKPLFKKLEGISIFWIDFILLEQHFGTLSAIRKKQQHTQ